MRRRPTRWSASAGGPGGRFGNRFGGRRNLRRAGGRGSEFAVHHGTPRGEDYAPISENGFVLAHLDARSTFSIDVDTASYSNVRRLLTQGRRPPTDAVRIEELVNYFAYDDPLPTGDEAFAVSVEIAGCPWNLDHRLARIGVRSPEIPVQVRQPANLVFLLDVSGSMQRPEKIGLLKRGMRLLVENLSAKDRVAIVVYAGAAGLVLPPTSCADKEPILAALERLEAGGSTDGGQGIRRAYTVARRAFIQGGVNRVVLATDGDFNMGIVDNDELVERIRREADGDIFLSVLGFGGGNYKDARLERLADEGNGNYAYVDSLAEARKVLVEEMGATLVTVAKDVKLQVEFDPAQVAAFRLIGYENRVLEHREFEDDTKDAGEVGAGHSVTALYEIVPVGAPLDWPGIDAEAASGAARSAPSAGGPMVTVRVRSKHPEGTTSRQVELEGFDTGLTDLQTSDDFRFAAAVAAFGMLLRDSEQRGGASYAGVRRLAAGALGRDPGGYRAGFLELLDLASELDDGR